MEFGRVKNLINGKWEDSKSEEISEIRNPAFDKIIGEVPMSTEDEVNRAVRAAKDAFPEWRATPQVTRARYLLRLCSLLEENFNELSIVQTKEHGKTIDESRGETRRGVECCEVAAGIPSLMMGEYLRDIARGIDEYTVNEPLGVFATIAPFNFPFMVPLWFIPFAIATGNTFVTKPAPGDPISQIKLHELIDEAGIPPGVVNLVNGNVDVANMLIDHQDVAGVTFVGSVPIAKAIYKKCGKLGKRAIANGGAKNYLIVMPDSDIEKVIPSMMNSFYGNSGQRCLAGAVALIVGDDAFYKKFSDAFIEAASKIKVGNGLNTNIQMGPLQSKDKKERVAKYIEIGVREGAKLVLDGRNIKLEEDLPHTCFLNPTVFENVLPDMTIAKEEIFGPVACIMRAKTLSQAINIINGLSVANASCIYTSSGKSAREFEKNVDAGNVGINVGVAAPMAFFPFGGRKDSFLGTLHADGKDVIRFFTDPKVIIKRWL